jgi:ferrous iron transport protein B
VVPTAARHGQGLAELVQTIDQVATGQLVCKPHHLKSISSEIDEIIAPLVQQIKTTFPNLPNARWVALRLLDGDKKIIEAVRKGQLGAVSPTPSLNLNWGVAA